MKNIRVLGFQFKTLAISGIWRPVDWTSKSQLILYNIYSFFFCFLIVSLPILQSQLLLVEETDFKLIADTLFTMLTSITVCVKITNFLFRREEIINLMNMLSKSWCVPNNDEEREILEKSNGFINLYTTVLIVLGQVTVASMLVFPLIRSDGRNILPVQIWLPRAIWDFHKHIIWFVYAYEALALSASGLIDAIADTTISGFMWQACTQLELARHRLNQLPRKLRQAVADNKKMSRETLMKIEQESIVHTVLHHNYAIEYAMGVNDVIDFVVVEQFIITSLNISIIVYQLSSNLSVGLIVYIVNFLYLGCMLFEFLGFCWFGNEITLKCEEFGLDVYRIDWCSLSTQTNKMLMHIILRTRKPVVLSVGHFVVLNLESFKSILKVSFTAFNILKEST